MILKAVVDAIISTVTEEVKKDAEIRLIGFGTFKKAQRAARKGRKMPSLSHGGHVVDKDSFLPVGDNPKSFDGRYYGTVPLSCVEYKAVMILPTGWLIRLWK